MVEHFGNNREPKPTIASENNSDQSEKDTYVIVTDIPEIKGGKKALLKKITVPQSFESLQTEGFVSVDFLIDEYGEASEFNIINSFNNEYDMAVINALKKTRFTPGKSSTGESVKFYRNVEVRFKPIK